MQKRQAGWLYLIYPFWAHAVVQAGYPAYALAGLWLLAATVEGLRAGGLPRTTRAASMLVGILCLATIDASIAEPLALYLPPVVVPLGLAIWFGNSLRPGRHPVIVRIAQAVTGDFGAKRAHYARTLTWVWAVVCAAMAMEAMLLAVFASAQTWSLITHFVNHLVLAALFMLELIFRWCYLGPPRQPWVMMKQLVAMDWGQLFRGDGSNRDDSSMAFRDATPLNTDGSETAEQQGKQGA